MLQQELNRMAAQTKSQELLFQLFELLNNDANNIIECMVRPSLVNQLILEKWKSALLKSVELTTFPKSQYLLNTEFNLSNNTTDTTDTNHTDLLRNLPASRSRHSAVWTVTEMIVWGGYNDSFNEVEGGNYYCPNSDFWVRLEENIFINSFE